MAMKIEPTDKFGLIAEEILPNAQQIECKIVTLSSIRFSPTETA
jgi:hypothetical protein